MHDGLKGIEEVTGGTTAAIISAWMYLPEVGTHAINSLFILINTGIAVLGSHYLKEWLSRRSKKTDHGSKKESSD